MVDERKDLLLVAGKLLSFVMQWACAAGALAMVVLSALRVIFRDRIQVTEYSDSLGNTEPLIGQPVFFLMVAGVLILGFFFFAKLKTIIESVHKGDPFSSENATSLTTMAWLLLAMQFLVMPTALIGAYLDPIVNNRDDFHVTVEMGPDVEGILMVIVLFILARVFKHGAEMREDLEGTV